MKKLIMTIFLLQQDDPMGWGHAPAWMDGWMDGWIDGRTHLNIQFQLEYPAAMVLVGQELKPIW
jgi:hypothetical protein